MLTLQSALEEAGAAIGRTDAQVIFAHLLGVDRAYLAAHPMRVLTESEDARGDSLVARRALGHPVAYLLGVREFYGRDFEVCPDVLIPRPETETLVEAVLGRLPGAGPGLEPPRVLDLGTGSGAIAVTLACERPDARVAASDRSPAALAVAARNAGAHGCRVELLEGCWYAPVAGRRFDLIASNPPYVAAGDPHLAAGDLRFEPAEALTDGSRDGLDSIRAIVAGAAAHLAPGGWLLFEHGHDQARAARALLEDAGFGALVSIADLAGIPRVAGGKIEDHKGESK
ncbi:MAG TPA: peptide chain release factor N(5)-glutamine methyltransferase [Myxococcota bacterium]|nr:peptide chain release factor N(5)-glutamine methyltransferase [Myxococcota bacterium]